jgi:hypothetical protein
MSHYLVLRVVNKEPELLDSNVIAYTEWHGVGEEESTSAFSRISVQFSHWCHRQGWIEGTPRAGRGGGLSRRRPAQ